MPSIVGFALTFALLAIALFALLGLASRFLQLQQRLQSCEQQLLGLERTERLTPARLAELAQLREAITSAEQLLAKVNRREIANGRKRAEDGTLLPTNPNGAGMDKDALRRLAGLRAGQPARHS